MSILVDSLLAVGIWTWQAEAELREVVPTWQNGGTMNGLRDLIVCDASIATSEVAPCLVR